MHIKKLEISGFKSFVDRTVIHFDHDIIGIVGPNGCGKSNIVDAIRWCIGEQSAKHLRGRSMSDVIFAGSSTRPAHGMAEVTLTFDNSDREAALALPLEYRDWAEIAITRRLYRDGTSEYLINKTPVRLKDVTDLFLGTGVGTKAYSVIEQGKVGLIVSARAEDRRMIIEEAAGITKYKARRKQAEQKMDLTRQNLLRVGDVVSEIERSLSSLKRQASKAERYLSYKAEVEDLVLHEASHRLLELIVVSQVQESARAEAYEQSQAARAALDARDAELEVHRQATLETEDAHERAQADAFRANNTVRTHEAELERARERFATLEARGEAARTEQHDLAERLDALSGEREALLDALANAEEEQSRGEDTAREAAEQLDELRLSQQEAEQKASTLRKQASEAQASIAAAEATLRGFEQRAADMQQRRDRLEDEDGRLSTEAEDHDARRSGLAEHIDELATRKHDSAELREQLVDDLKSARESIVELDRAVDVAKGELSQKRNRLRALEELHARLEGVGKGAKALVATKDPTIVGLVADRIEAPSDLTAALAGALGEKLQWVVVDELARGVELLGQLAKDNKGRASIVARRPRHVAGARRNTPSEDGVVGWLADRLHYAHDDEALAQSLVGDVLVVRDVEAATRLLQAGSSARMVTLDGTLFDASGAVTGGAGDAVAAGMLEQKREMRELHEAVAVRDADVTRLLEQQSTARARIAELSSALERARQDAHQAELGFVTAEKDLKRSEDQLATIQRRLVAVRTDLAELSAKLETTAGERERATIALEENRTRRRDLDDALGEAEAHADAWRDQVSRQQSRVTESRVLLAQVRERATSVKQTVDRLGRSCDEMRARVAKLEQEQLEAALGAGQAAGRMVVEREALAEAVVVAKKAEDTLLAAKIALDEARLGLSTLELALKDLRAETAEATERLRTHETNLAKLEIERRHLVDGVRERFRGLELPTVVGDYHKRSPVDAAHRARISELTELLDRMGPVNLDAVRELKEAEERHVYYTTQKADLEGALADLEQAIAQMNKETKRLFKEAFEGINERFKVLFPKMFRGGQAELKLTNPEDMLETGIEILAQPPGKKLSSIELMSGGEKALTAVSLIFAIFQYKPSPFCVLDEVDAPLDEANVTRYNEAIRSMTHSSQFILITHIKKTMQSVDVLYGVTMQEPGVSKLVGVKVNESAAARSQSAPSATAAGGSTPPAAVA